MRLKRRGVRRLILGLTAGVWLLCSVASGQQMTPSWQEQVRHCAEERDWNAALQIVEQQISLAPRDMDVRAWRARVLLWSGRLADAEHEYQEILAVAAGDPDNWVGLATTYLREGQPEKADDALKHALALDPKRADIHAARGRALRAAHNTGEARREFQKALDLDPASEEARAGLRSLQATPKHELRLGANTDLFSFAEANHDEGATLTSRWTPRWKTTLAGNVYRWAGIDAQKLVASGTGQLPRWGALEVGGATANDNGVIPRAEAFFDYDRGWKLGSNAWVRGLEAVYGQHWYWYSAARILTINQMMVFYLPNDWTWSMGLIEARSHFTGTETEWRPSGIARLGFPIVGKDERRLVGNCFFAAGTEDFAQVNQLGRFSSQTYGGGLRFQLTARQDVTAVAAFQKRTTDQTETSFGFTYGIRF